MIILVKDLSGGKIVVKAPTNSTMHPAKMLLPETLRFMVQQAEKHISTDVRVNVLPSETAEYIVVVEGIGDHGCEYMTGGRVVILGDVGKNFAAGMSGGIAYVLADEMEAFKALCNPEMIEFETLDDIKDNSELKELISKTTCIIQRARKPAMCWRTGTSLSKRFVKVIPKDYKRMMNSIEEHKQAGSIGRRSFMSAFRPMRNQSKKSTKEAVTL